MVHGIIVSPNGEGLSAASWLIRAKGGGCERVPPPMFELKYSPWWPKECGAEEAVPRGEAKGQVRINASQKGAVWQKEKRPVVTQCSRLARQREERKKDKQPSVLKCGSTS